MIIAACIALALAQDSANARPQLELADVYASAETHSPRVAAAHAMATASRARSAAVGTRPDPQLQFGYMNYELPSLRPMDGIGMAQLQVMQMVPLGGKLRLARNAASYQADAERERALVMDWEVRAKVASAFYDVYVADRSLAIDRETVALLRDVLRSADAMYRSGEGSQTDVLRAQLEIARMEQDTLRMSMMRASQVARLQSVVGTPVNVAGVSVALPQFPEAPPPLDSLLAAVGATPALRATLRDMDAASTQITAAQRETWPDLNVGVQYGQRAGMTGTARMGSLMIGAAIPVFARSRQSRMREEALAMSHAKRFEMQATRADVEASMAEARADIERARTSRALYRTTLLPQAEAVATSSLSAFGVGLASFMTQLDNRMNVARYRKELVILDADEGRAWAELEMLMGRQEFDARSANARNGRNAK